MSHKILNFLKITTSILILLIVVYAGEVFAQDYKVLTPLPGIGDSGGTTTLEKYVPNMFKLLIGLSAVWAVLMIVIGGFQYISTDAITGKSAGRERIKNAIFGLVLVIGAWLILVTINPKIMSFDLNISPATPSNADLTTTAPISGGSGGSATIDYLQNKLSSTCPDCAPARTDLTYNLSQAYIDNFSCTTCQPLANNIPAGGNTNTNISPITNIKLSAMADDLKLSWYVSEAYPPMVQHADPCHLQGTCIDANFGNSTVANATNINTFINTASSKGLRAVYEVQTQKEKVDLINSGVQEKFIDVVPTINRNHFSVYNN